MSEDNILGAILAGGQSKRMGKDKLFLEFDNKKLIEHTIDKVKKYLKKIIKLKQKIKLIIFLKTFFYISLKKNRAPFYKKKMPNNI